MSLSKWDAPSGAYTSAIPKGTAAFRKVTAEMFGFTRTEVVRDASRCRQSRSEHCECGAVDEFTTDVPKGRKLFDACVRAADELGIQDVIFNRRVVGFGNPTERRYTGPSPHTDHVHIGLNRWARANLTEKMVRDAFSGAEEDDMAQIPQDEWEQMKEDIAAIRKALYKVVGGKPKEHLNLIEDKVDDLLARG